MRISWVVANRSVIVDGDRITSPLASYRYRVLIPMRELEARGHACRLYELSAGAGTPDHPVLSESDAIIFAKNHGEREDVVALLDHARARGVATIVDVCDDYLEPGEALATYYAALTRKADLVTVSSVRLASAVGEATAADVCVVRDPYEGPRGAARFAPRLPNLEALWFGTPFNLASLLGEIGNLSQRIDGFQLNLRVLTRECPGLVDAFRQMNSRNRGKLTLDFEEWSLERNWLHLQRCDVVLITVDQQQRFFMAKGSNRLVETLRAGRFPIAHPLPAYQEFNRCAWVGSDIASGLAWALAHPHQVVDRITAGQDYIGQHYAPAATALDWEGALARTRHKPPA